MARPLRWLGGPLRTLIRVAVDQASPSRRPPRSRLSDAPPKPAAKKGGE